MCHANSGPATYKHQEESEGPQSEIYPRKPPTNFHSTGREHALGVQTLLTLTHLVCAEGWEDGAGGGFVVSRASLAQLTL